MDLFIPDPPYSVLPVDRDQLSETEMTEVSFTAQHYLANKGTGIIFCSFIQFPSWVQHLEEQNLLVEKTPLIFLPPPGGLYRKYNTKYLVNIAEIAVVFHKSRDYPIDTKVFFLTIFTGLFFHLIFLQIPPLRWKHGYTYYTNIILTRLRPHRKHALLNDNNVRTSHFLITFLTLFSEILSPRGKKHGFIRTSIRSLFT